MEFFDKSLVQWVMSCSVSNARLGYELRKNIFSHRHVVAMTCRRTLRRSTSQSKAFLYGTNPSVSTDCQPGTWREKRLVIGSHVSAMCVPVKEVLLVVALRFFVVSPLLTSCRFYGLDRINMSPWKTRHSEDPE